MTEQISAEAIQTPFPHLIFHNFYNDEELDLIWEELNFYTKPDKLLDVKEYMGCLLYTSPSPRDVEESRIPSSA